MCEMMDSCGSTSFAYLKTPDNQCYRLAEHDNLFPSKIDHRNDTLYLKYVSDEKC